MAAVLEGLASLLKDTLTTKMASKEVAMLLGVPGDIEKLEENLGVIKDLLADAERKRITDKSVQGWVLKLKDVMYDAADILDICNLKAEERQESATGVNLKCFNSLVFCMRNPCFAHDIGSRIKELNKKLDGICESAAKFSFIRTVNNCDQVTPPQIAGDKSSPVIERSSLVGEKIQEDTTALVDILTNEGRTNDADNYMKVVAICGAGGIGKTTLARNIYNHQTIKEKFNKSIWLSVTKNCSKVELLKDALIQAEGDYCHPHPESLLEQHLVNAIKDKKILLVLDDVWSGAVWNNSLKPPFSHAARGSRVLVTTRHDGVACAMNAQHPHHVDYLGLEDAWTLLKKEVLATERMKVEIDALKNIGLQILDRCGGLPLAIKAIGGLLRQRSMNIVDWERVLNSSAWSIDGMPQELNRVIYLSYDDLPPHLKQCLLYYSLIPKSVDIGRDPLIEMWIGEGLVGSSHSDNLEETGNDYYDELIKRNLIELDKGYFGRSRWIMHDIVRSFCQYMVKDEALVAHMGETDIGTRHGSQKYRLLSTSVQSGSNELEWSVLQKYSSLRTLISFGPIKFKTGDTLSGLSRLRTLYIHGVDFSPVVHHLCELKHLRYLNITLTEISRLPDSISQLKFLQHLWLAGCKNMVELPNGIVKLKQLRSLIVRGTTINSIPKGFGALTNLRNIHEFPVNMDGDSWCSLEELGLLSQLRYLQLKGLENVNSSSLAAKAMLSSKQHLVNLILNCSSRLGDDGWPVLRDLSVREQQRIEEVFDELSPPESINYLEIGGYFGHRLPNWLVTMTAGVPLQRLQHLILKDISFCNQLPDGLGQLPCLETLHVSHAPAITCVGSKFMSRGRPLTAFPRLHKLVFRGMVSWKEWEWKPDAQVEAIPVLEELVLDNCELLKHLPPGLAFHARALKKLVLAHAYLIGSVENLLCVVELVIECCHELKRINNLPCLQKLKVTHCPDLEVLEGVPALQRLYLQHKSMRKLPRYLRGLNLTHLSLCLCCSLRLVCIMALGKSTTEWDMFCNIGQVEAHYCSNQTECLAAIIFAAQWPQVLAQAPSIERQAAGVSERLQIFTVSYTRNPRYLETNINSRLLGIMRKMFATCGCAECRSLLVVR